MAHITKKVIKTFLLGQEVSHCRVIPKLTIAQQSSQELFQLSAPQLDYLLTRVEVALFW